MRVIRSLIRPLEIQSWAQIASNLSGVISAVPARTSASATQRWSLIRPPGVGSSPNSRAGTATSRSLTIAWRSRLLTMPPAHTIVMAFTSATTSSTIRSLVFGKAITIECAGGIVSSRDRHAIVSDRDVAVPAREFGDDPTPGGLIKDHRWVAEAEVLAGTAETTPERFDAIWAQD